MQSKSSNRKNSFDWVERTALNPIGQAQAVQRVDNFIQRISHYPVDKTYWLEYIKILSAG